MIRTDIETAVGEFKSKSGPDERYTSFDYCYNHFSSTGNITKDVEKKLFNARLLFSKLGHV